MSTETDEIQQPAVGLQSESVPEAIPSEPPPQPRQQRRPQRQNSRRGDVRAEGRGDQFGDGRGRPQRDNGLRRRPQPEADLVAVPPISYIETRAQPREELLAHAVELGLQVSDTGTPEEIAYQIVRVHLEQAGFLLRQGTLDIIEDGFGFLRQSRYLPANDDVYVSQSQIRRFGLRTGDFVIGLVRAPKETEKYHSLLRVEAVNGMDPEVAKRRPNFDQLTPIYPNRQLVLESGPKSLSARIIDLVAPIGRGQRGLIVSPPKAGKTTLLKAIANGVTHNYPDVHLMMLLIGERPEEVTDIRRSVNGEVVASTFDEPVEDHTKVAEMALDRAKRLVESGTDVVILMDSITRLARAYNLVVPVSGRTLSGGIDPVALYPPKRFFGAARNLDEGGSLTIIATCLVDTGSRMDDVIYEEFKGTGNLELHLDRKLQERRVFPAIDVQRSSTRREELLLGEAQLRQVWTMRRMVTMLGGIEGTELLLQRLTKTENNQEFLATLNKEVL